MQCSPLRLDRYFFRIRLTEVFYEYLPISGISGGPEVFRKFFLALSLRMLSISSSCGVEYFRGGGKTRFET